MRDEPGHHPAEAARAAEAGLTRRHVGAAILACGALALTVAGRLTACPGCEYEVLGVPLFAAGSALYLGLGLLALFGVSLRLIGFLSLFGVAVQAGLVRFLLMIGAPCVTCLAAAASLLALAFTCLWPDRWWRLAPGVVAILGVAALPLWSNLLTEAESLAGLPEFARSADLKSPPVNATLLVVYERENCPYCRAFKEKYEPNLERDFGPALTIRRIDAKDRRGLGRLPSFLIRSPDESLVVVRGLPSYPDLADRIRSAAGGNK